MTTQASLQRRQKVKPVLWLPLLALMLALGFMDANAQCSMNLSTNLTSDNSSSVGATFEITAQRAMRLCRISTVNNSTSAQTGVVEVWAHPNGFPWARIANPAGVNDGLWYLVGTANVTFNGKAPANYTEIPVDLSVLGVLSPGQKVGFAILGSYIGYRSGVAPYLFSNGDLTIDTECWGPTGSTGPGNTTNLTFSNFPRQFCGKVSYALVTSPDDAGIRSIDSPLNFCAGSLGVQVTLGNYGTNPLTSANINWSLNGVPQTPLAWTGFLDTVSQATRFTQVTLATMNFAPGVPYTIKAWTSSPNGVADTVNLNDTLTVTRKSALSGTFTIGGGLADYATFAAAAADLTANGVCGPVVFKVRNGSYTGQVTIGAIPGVSAVNPVVFESESGDRNSVTLSYSATASADNFVLNLAGASYVTFRNMTLSANGGTYAQVVNVQNGTQYCTLENLNLNSIPVTSTSTNYAVIYSPSGSIDNYNTIRGCTVSNGSYGMYWYGDGTTALESGTLIERNKFVNNYYSGMYLYYQDAPIARFNTVTSNSTGTMYLMSFGYCDNKLVVNGNTIFANGAGTKYGLRVYYSDAAAGSEGIISNNFITIMNGSATVYGLYPYYSNYQKFLYNSIYTNSTSTSNYTVYSYYGGSTTFGNNIIINNGSGYAWYCTPTAGTNVIASDYNVLFAPNTNLAYWGGAARATLADLRTANGFETNSISKAVNFLNLNNGDLHLAGASEDDQDLVGDMEPEVADDIDEDPRIIPFRGADEACYITRGTVQYSFVDAGGQATPFANVPGTVGVKYQVAFPEFDANITVTLNFYTVPGNVFSHTTSFQVQKQYGQTLDGYYMIPLGTLNAGTYRVEAVFHTKNSCGGWRDYKPGDRSLVLLPQGNLPCVVYPGDVNNDGIVNFGDRKSLTTYIHDANMRATWLNGPARYRPDAATNPLTYYTWEPQASMPWTTAEGCYMDADGNGTVNNFDFLLIKVNWMRQNAIPSPKPGDTFAAGAFDMSQNFPNPFNPTTTIRYSAPERASVNIVVMDLMGRQVATLAATEVEAGVYTVAFDASALANGSYIAVATMQGLESGMSFSKSIRMTLAK